MKQLIYTLVLAVGIWGCDNRTNKAPDSNSDTLQTRTEKGLSVERDADSMTSKSNVEERPIQIESIQLDPTKIECMPLDYRFGDNSTFFSPGTFGKMTYIYNSIEDSREIIDSLKFNTPVNILHEYPEYFLVCIPKAKAGYVKKTDLYLHNLGSCVFGIIKYGTNDPVSCRKCILKAMKIDEKNSIIDEYIDSISGKDYNINCINNAALKNVNAIFYLAYSCYSEEGVSKDHFIVDNGKLSRLILSGSEGDGGYSDLRDVYIPIKLGKKVVLAKNGILTVDQRNGKVETYPYPSNCGIPIEELVVVEEKSMEDQWDQEKGEFAYNKDGTVSSIITINQTTFYQWNGAVLKKVKVIKGK